MARKPSLLVFHFGKTIESKQDLLKAVLEEIEKRKRALYRHLEIILPVRWDPETPYDKAEKELKIAAHEWVMRTLQGKLHGYTVRGENYIENPEAAIASFRYRYKWTIYWGPSCPHCGKSTG